MKKMNKVLALLAFAGVVTGVSLHGAALDVAHPLAVAVKADFDVFKSGVIATDLKDSALLMNLLDTTAQVAWKRIETQRAAGTSFTTLFTDQEVQCVLNGFDHVVVAFENAAAAVIWTRDVSSTMRDQNKDAVLGAIDHLVGDIQKRTTVAVGAGHIYAADKPRIMADVMQQTAALKARVTKVFTTKPTSAEITALNAQPVGAHLPQAHLLKDRVAGHAAVAEETTNAAKASYLRQAGRMVRNGLWLTTKTAVAVAMVYGGAAVAQANGWM